jgi:hypothetical protein
MQLKVECCCLPRGGLRPPKPNPTLTLCCSAGVSDNRLQNVVITLDKVKLCMEQGQCREPPLRLLADAEVAEHLWTGACPRAPTRTEACAHRARVRPVAALFLSAAWCSRAGRWATVPCGAGAAQRRIRNERQEQRHAASRLGGRRAQASAPSRDACCAPRRRRWPTRQRRARWAPRPATRTCGARWSATRGTRTWRRSRRRARRAARPRMRPSHGRSAARRRSCALAILRRDDCLCDCACVSFER